MSPELIQKIEFVLEVLGAITICATVIVRLTPNPKDDGVVKKISDVLFKVIEYLPTLGVNPKTKEMKEALKAYKND